MKNKTTKYKILKDLPGANLGDIIIIHELESPKTDTTPIRGCSIGGKYWFESEILNFTDFFKLIDND